MTRLIIAIIYFYRWFISLFLPSRCRFEPTCSRYAINALECHGLIKGLWLTLKRLVRCHPYEKISQQMGVAWGYDPIPKKETANYSSPSHSNSKKN